MKSITNTTMGGPATRASPRFIVRSSSAVLARPCSSWTTTRVAATPIGTRVKTSSRSRGSLRVQALGFDFGDDARGAPARKRALERVLRACGAALLSVLRVRVVALCVLVPSSTSCLRLSATVCSLIACLGWAAAREQQAEPAASRAALRRNAAPASQLAHALCSSSFLIITPAPQRPSRRCASARCSCAPRACSSSTRSSRAPSARPFWRRSRRRKSTRWWRRGLFGEGGG